MAKRVGGKINVDRLTNAVLDELGEFAIVTQEALENAIEETAEETAEAIKLKAPVRTGKYKESITYGRTGKKGTMMVYAEAPEYRLTHLLEKGHASRDGGRVRPSPDGGHWNEPYQSVPDKIVRKLKDNILK